MRIGTAVVRHELRTARDIARAAATAAANARGATPEADAYLAALAGAKAACEAAITAFDQAIRISEESEQDPSSGTPPARSGPTGSETHSSTPTQAESDRTGDTLP